MLERSDFVLYRMYGYDAALLYVGKTMRRPFCERLSDHRRTKDWWLEVATVTLQRAKTARDLARLEAEAIATEHPRYNLREELPYELVVPPTAESTARSQEASRRRAKLDPDRHQGHFFDELRKHQRQGFRDTIEIWSERARKAGVSEDDIAWAIANPLQPFVRRIPAQERAARLAAAGLRERTKEERAAALLPPDLRD